MAVTEQSQSREPGQELSWVSHGITHTGRVRRHNEDALLERPDIGLWAVADGMGGHSAGDVASQMIVDALGHINATDSLPDVLDDIEDRLMEVNQQLLEMASTGEKQLTIGSTVVALVAHARLGLFLWAGDSRLYRHREGRLQQLSTDHSQVELYIEQGLIRREQASSHPHGNMITRAVGANEQLFLDMDLCRLKPGDRFLLCSDGLTKHVTDLELRDLLPEGDVAEVSNRLIELTLARGAADNVTVVVVDIANR